MNWFHLKLAPLPLKRARGFSKIVIVRDAGGMVNFARGRGIVLWVDDNLGMSVFDHSNIFQMENNNL